MARILSIETSTRTSSVALHQEGKLIASQQIYAEKSHASYLSLSIKNMMETSGMKLDQLDAVAISEGPGSYTGLRIGTSTAKGLCYALDIKMIAINTLKSMASGMTRYYDDQVLYCPMIDARRMEVYCLLADNKLNELQPTRAKIIDASSFSDLLDTQKIVFFGDGSQKCRQTIIHDNAIFVDGINANAEYTGVLAHEAFQQEDFVDVAYFEPFYLKDFVAKKPSARKLV